MIGVNTPTATNNARATTADPAITHTRLRFRTCAVNRRWSLRSRALRDRSALRNRRPAARTGSSFSSEVATENRRSGFHADGTACMSGSLGCTTSARTGSARTASTGPVSASLSALPCSLGSLGSRVFLCSLDSLAAPGTDRAPSSSRGASPRSKPPGRFTEPQARTGRAEPRQPAE